MCTSPIVLRNTNRHYKALDRFGSDTKSQMMLVPCGKCHSCISLRQNYIVQRVQMESLENFIFFGTLTYNEKSLPSIDVNGYNIKYADVEDFQNMIRYIRKHEDLPNFRYLACSEFGGRRHRPHWHFLLFIPHSIFDKPLEQIKTYEIQALSIKLSKIFLKYWRHNVGSRKNPVWVDNCTFKFINGRRNYDFDFVDTLNKNSDDVSFYVTKYVCKFDDYVDRLRGALRRSLDDDSFKEIWSKVRPRFLFSKRFGNPYSPKVKAYISKCISRTINQTSYPFPCFFNIVTGQSFPLSPYYRKKMMSFDQEMEFRNRQLSASPTGVLGDTEFSNDLSALYDSMRLDKIKHMIRSRDQDIGILFSEHSFNVGSFLDLNLSFDSYDPYAFSPNDDF